MDLFGIRAPIAPLFGRPDKVALRSPVLEYPGHLDRVTRLGERGGFEIQKDIHAQRTPQNSIRRFPDLSGCSRDEKKKPLLGGGSIFLRAAAMTAGSTDYELTPPIVRSRAAVTIHQDRKSTRLNSSP